MDDGDGGIRCAHCGGRRAIFGPVWNDSLHDREFVEDLLSLINEESKNESDTGEKVPRFNTLSRLRGMLNVVLEELDDSPFYFHADELCKVLHCTPPTLLQLR